MEIINKNIVYFFEEKLSNLSCQDDTRSYIISIYGKYRNSSYDLSKDNITILFSKAKFSHDFNAYQNLGDWLFYVKTIYPEFLKNATEDYYNAIAQSSYYSCYNMIKSWDLYKQLAQDYIRLTNECRKLITKN
jgi:hypothetical protein